jgi:hypothetical protein
MEQYKYLHKFYINHDILWVKLVWRYYSDYPPMHPVPLDPSGEEMSSAFIVNSLARLSAQVQGQFCGLLGRSLVRAGPPEPKLRLRFPRLHSLATDKPISVRLALSRPHRLVSASTQAFDEIGTLTSTFQSTNLNENADAI